MSKESKHRRDLNIPTLSGKEMFDSLRNIKKLL